MVLDADRFEQVLTGHRGPVWSVDAARCVLLRVRRAGQEYPPVGVQDLVFVEEEERA